MPLFQMKPPVAYCVAACAEPANEASSAVTETAITLPVRELLHATRLGDMNFTIGGLKFRTCRWSIQAHRPIACEELISLPTGTQGFFSIFFRLGERLGNPRVSNYKSHNHSGLQFHGREFLNATTPIWNKFVGWILPSGL